ncbi:hypothetical protein Tco_0646652 [Tanacetum coccineum]
MKNRFDIFLSDENVNEETNEGDQVKILIKRACDMGIPISDDDTGLLIWLTCIMTCGRKGAYKAEQKKIVDLEWERRRAEVDLFLVSKEVMTDNIRDVWSDDMMEVSENEVEEVNDATASFMVQNELSNDSDVSMTHVREDEVKLFIREECLSMCAIVETRLRKKSVNTVCERLNAGWAWTSNAVESRKGCIIIVGAAILLTSVVVLRLLVLQFMGLMGFLGLLSTQDMFQVQLAMVLVLSACFLVQALGVQQSVHH